MLDLIAETETSIQRTFKFDSNSSRLSHRVEISGKLIGDSERISRQPTGDHFGDWWKEFLMERSAPDTDLRVRPIRVLDLFSSVGGLTLGFGELLRDLGMRMESLLAVDLDPDALKVYSTNFHPHRVLNESVKNLVEARIRNSGLDARYAFPPEIAHSELDRIVGKVDVVLAGPPCQGHSNLNNHSRRDDPRNDLYLTVPSIAIALGARIVIIENVPSVVHDKEGVVQTAIALFRQNGYQVTTQVIAADDLGWAQTRKRFFIVAALNETPVSLQVIKREFHQPAHGVGWAIGDLLDQEVGQEVGRVEHTTGNMSAENQERVLRLFKEDLYNLPNDSRPKCHQGGTTYSSVYGRMWWDKPAPTLTTGFQSPGRGRFVHPLRPRVLTPREAARIQGFPDWFRFMGADGSSANRTQMGKWIGDAVPSILGYTAGLAAANLL